MVTGRLPSSTNPGTQSFISRQIDSLRPYCSQIDIHEVVGNKLFKHIQSARYISKIAHNYDVIHVHYGLFAVAAILGKGSTPIVLSLMGSDIFGTADITGKVTFLTALEARLTKWLVGMCDRVIVKTKQMAEAIPKIQTDIIPNGVDLQLFNERSMLECRKLLGWEKDCFYVLFPGNPARPEKNWNLAVKSIEVAQKLVNKKINLIPLHKVLSNDVPLYINASNLVLMTSYSEGSPNVIKEALACNKVIVSVDVGDVSITIGNLEGCSIVEYNSTSIGDETANRLNDCITIVKGSKRLSELSLDLNSVAGKIVRIYQEILSIGIEYEGK